MFMCKPHWRMVPKNVQRDIWAAYRPGQERDKRPTVRYLYVTGIAKYMVKLREMAIPPEMVKPALDDFSIKLKKLLGVAK